MERQCKLCDHTVCTNQGRIRIELRHGDHLELKNIRSAEPIEDCPIKKAIEEESWKDKFDGGER